MLRSGENKSEGRETESVSPLAAGIKALGVTQQQFAQSTGVSISLVYKVISGDREPTREFAMKSAPKINMSPDQYLLAERIAGLRRKAAAGDLSPQYAVKVAMQAADMGDSEEADAIRAGLVKVVEQALQVHEPEGYKEFARECLMNVFTPNDEPRQARKAAREMHNEIEQSGPGRIFESER